MRRIGVLAERYSKWERRAPLTPLHVQQLVSSGIEVLVQPSNSRVFNNREYADAGARVTPDLSSANAIFGVKQPALGSLLPGMTYLTFSHVIKAQPENMPLMDEFLAKRCRLIDYECVREGGGGSTPRLIAFGGFAGKAGTINGLRGLGLRLLTLGYSTPFLAVGPAHSYADYADARRALAGVGRQIGAYGLPPAFSPFVVTICGTGNVSHGAVDALRALGDDVVSWVTPEELPALSEKLGTEGAHQRRVFACVTGTEHFVAREGGAAGGAAGAPFDRAHYYANPHEYAPVFHRSVAPHTSLLVTTMYWDPRFPRLLTHEQAGELRASGNERLLAVADLTCDIGGAVEGLTRTTSVDEPFFVYDVAGRCESAEGLDGAGVLMLGVDILPAELPREASHHFGDALLPFVDALASSPGAPLPPELAAATIAEGGALTAGYHFIAAMRAAREREISQEEPALAAPTAALSAEHARKLEGSTVLSLHGHLFDSGLINATLDVVEAAGGCGAGGGSTPPPSPPPLSLLLPRLLRPTSSDPHPPTHTLRPTSSDPHPPTHTLRPTPSDPHPPTHTLLGVALARARSLLPPRALARCLLLAPLTHSTA